MSAARTRPYFRQKLNSFLPNAPAKNATVVRLIPAAPTPTVRCSDSGYGRFIDLGGFKVARLLIVLAWIGVHESFPGPR